MNTQNHWEKVYREKAPDAVSWYCPHLETSLQLVEKAAPARSASIIDVGGGESTLVDDLLERGYRSLSVLDISNTAIDATRNRLGKRADLVSWLVGDITAMELPKRHFDVWHDRAVFHFLTNSAGRQAYVRQASEAVKPGGHVIVATFGTEGPLKCSGLDVVRYDAESLHEQFGAQFQLVKHLSEQHRTPFGTVQQFLYCYCKLSG